MENNYGEFAELLFRTHYNNYASPEEVKSKLYPLRDWIKDHIPQKLYRYRTFSKYSIEALKNDEIWGSSIMTFNDPYECLPYYDITEVNTYISNEFSVDVVKRNFDRIASNNMPPKFLNAFPKELIEKLKTIKMDIPTVEQLSKIMPKIMTIFVNYWQANLNELDIQFFSGVLNCARMYHIACFSENNSSILMWSNYANNHTGFCVEYDIKSALCDCSEKCADVCYCPGIMLSNMIAPVIYQDTRYDASLGFMSLLMDWTIDVNNWPFDKIYYDMLSVIKGMLVKGKEWEYEKEWRLFKCPETDQFIKHKLITKMKPTAVYLGTSITPHNKARLKNICRKKEIPCYQMNPQFYSTKFEFIPFEIK